MDHKILLKKLDYYGIRGLALRWFESDRTNRKQAGKIGLNYPSLQTVVCGVPQGSVLGPLLFLIYINNIHISSSKVKFDLFVDDTCVFHSSKNLHTLQIEVNGAVKNISDWLISNKLTLNIDKSNLLFFNMNNIQKTDLDIRLGNEKLEVKEYAKYLGIHIDSKLTWEKQIQIPNSKLHKGICIIWTMRHFLQKKQLELLFSAFVSPYLDYGALAW